MKITNDIEIMGFYTISVFDQNNNLVEERSGHNLLMDKFIYDNASFLNAVNDFTLNNCIKYAYITQKTDPVAIKFTLPGPQISQSNNTITTNPPVNLDQYVGWTLHYDGDTTSQNDCKITSKTVEGVYTTDRSQTVGNSNFTLCNTLSSLKNNFLNNFGRDSIPIKSMEKKHESDSTTLSVSSICTYEALNTTATPWVINNVMFHDAASSNTNIASRFFVSPTITVNQFNNLIIKYTLVTKKSNPNQNLTNHNSIVGNFAIGRSTFQHRISGGQGVAAQGVSTNLETDSCFEFPNNNISIISNDGTRFRNYSQINTPRSIVKTNPPEGQTAVYNATAYFLNQTGNNKSFGNILKFYEDGYNYGIGSFNGSTPGYTLSWTGDLFTFNNNYYLKTEFEWKLRRIILD